MENCMHITTEKQPLSMKMLLKHPEFAVAINNNEEITASSRPQRRPGDAVWFCELIFDQKSDRSAE